MRVIFCLFVCYPPPSPTPSPLLYSCPIYPLFGLSVSFGIACLSLYFWPLPLGPSLLPSMLRSDLGWTFFFLSLFFLFVSLFPSFFSRSSHRSSLSFFPLSFLSFLCFPFFSLFFFLSFLRVLLLIAWSVGPSIFFSRVFFSSLPLPSRPQPGCRNYCPSCLFTP